MAGGNQVDRWHLWLNQNQLPGSSSHPEITSSLLSCQSRPVMFLCCSFIFLADFCKGVQVVLTGGGMQNDRSTKVYIHWKDALPRAYLLAEDKSDVVVKNVKTDAQWTIDTSVSTFAELHEHKGGESNDLSLVIDAVWKNTNNGPEVWWCSVQVHEPSVEESKYKWRTAFLRLTPPPPPWVTHPLDQFPPLRTNIEKMNSLSRLTPRGLNT